MADQDRAAQPARWPFWAFIGFMLVLMALFVVLGIWQVERLGEKEHLIANVSSRMNLAPEPLPSVGEWSAFDTDAWNYRPVSVAGTFRPVETVLVFTSLADQRGKFSGPGYWVMTPLELAAGGTVFINRGFVPEASAEAFAAGGTVEPGLVSLEGVARATSIGRGSTSCPSATSTPSVRPGCRPRAWSTRRRTSTPSSTPPASPRSPAPPSTPARRRTRWCIACAGSASDGRVCGSSPPRSRSACGTAAALPGVTRFPRMT